MASLASLLLLTGIAQASLQIIPGATWTATNTGAHVQAHGAGITQVGSTYYLIGEDKTDGSAFQNINCYSSENLVEWTFVNALLSRTESGDLGPSRVVERPKVIYNDATATYVMYLHIDSSDYGEAEVGVATSSEVCGDYEYLGSWRPLGFESRDIGLFKDDDGAGYLLTEDRPNGLRIDALTEDYLNVSSNVYLWDENIESPTIWKTNGYYFMLGSSLTGWDPNDNTYSYATSLSGPWSSWATFADVGSNTYASQISFVLPLNTNTAIYMGDRWDSSNLMRSSYIWLPLELTGETSLHVTNRVNWVPSVSSSGWSTAPAETYYEAEDGTLSGGAAVASCSGCTGGEAVGNIGGPDGGSVTIEGVSSEAAGRTTLRLKSLNGNTAQRYAMVSVNGVSQEVAFLPTSDGQTPGSSSVHVDLEAGGGNTIVVSGSGTYGPDLDGVYVPVS